MVLRRYLSSACEGNRLAGVLFAGALLASAGCSRSPVQPVSRPAVTRPVERSSQDNSANSSQVRHDAMEHARRSCVETARAKAPKRPGKEAKIDSYCSCFVTKGLSRFSNTELAALGEHDGQFTPQQRSFLTDAAHQCREEMNSSK